MRYLTECTALLAAIRRCEGLTVARHAVFARTELSRRRGHQESHLVLHRILMPPLTEVALIEVQPVLLGTNDHAWAHESHESNYLIGRKAMTVDEIRSDETAGPTKTSFAVYCNCLVLVCDHIVSKVDELPYEWERWACAVIEDHIEVLYAERGEV